MNALSSAIPGGFVISSVDLGLSSWDRLSLGNVSVYLARCNQRRYQTNGDDILVLGDIYYSPAFDISNALAEMKRRLDNSIKEFLAAVKSISGRFAVLFIREGKHYVLNDAGAFMPVFYATSAPLAASHDVLVALARNGDHARRKALRTKWGYPGDISRFVNVFALVANHALCLETRGLERICLNADDRVDTNPTELSEQIAHHIRESVRAASADRQLYMGLTGGLDSRLTLAATIDLKDRIKFFTYSEGQPSSRKDVDIARALSKAFGLEHSVLRLNLRKEPGFESYLEQFKFRNAYLHNAQLPYAYHAYFNDSDGVMIRSNYYEAIRADIQRRTARFELDMSNASEVARYYEVMANSGRVRDVVAKAFSEYFRRNATIDACRHFDPWDVFFSEHRMTAWMGQVISGTDYAFNTTCVPINSHALISQIYSLGVPDRVERQVFTRVIDTYLPKARDIPYAKD